jgi:hypothetical protein
MSNDGHPEAVIVRANSVVADQLMIGYGSRREL